MAVVATTLRPQHGKSSNPRFGKATSCLVAHCTNCVTCCDDGIDDMCLPNCRYKGMSARLLRYYYLCITYGSLRGVRDHTLRSSQNHDMTAPKRLQQVLRQALASQACCTGSITTCCASSNITAIVRSGRCQDPARGSDAWIQASRPRHAAGDGRTKLPAGGSNPTFSSCSTERTLPLAQTLGHGAWHGHRGGSPTTASHHPYSSP